MPTLDDPRLLPLLLPIYVARSDGELSDADSEHLHDRPWHLELLEWRAAHQVAAPAARIKKRANENPAQRGVLNLMCDLHVLTRIEHDRGRLLEHGQNAAATSKAVRRPAIELSAESRAHARDLVDTFLIPDAALAAPIAR